MIQKLTGVPETLLIPLWARAVESSREDCIVKDDMAVDMISKIDYDFSKFDNSWMSQTGVAVRTQLFDDETRDFIERNPHGVVINIGCGLDTRFFRVDNEKIIWYDLDLPEPIRIKKNFLKETERYRMIVRSVFDYSWLDIIEQSDRPVLILAEGVLMYFKETEIRELMSKLAQKFKNGEMIIEVMPAMAVKGSKHHDTVNKVGASFLWGIKSGKDIEEYSPNIQFMYEKNFFDYHKKRWRWLGKIAVIPFIHNNFNDRLVHLKFI